MSQPLTVMWFWLRYHLKQYIDINKSDNTVSFLDFLLDIVHINGSKNKICERMEEQFQLYFPMCPFPRRNFLFYVQYPLKSASQRNHLFLLSAWLNLNSACKPTVSTTVLKIEDRLQRHRDAATPFSLMRGQWRLEACVFYLALKNKPKWTSRHKSTLPAPLTASTQPVLPLKVDKHLCLTVHLRVSPSSCTCICVIKCNFLTHTTYIPNVVISTSVTPMST